MSRSPSFTIVTPSYNQGRFIAQTIQSVLIQREADLSVQYIVCDGLSGDDTPSVIERFQAGIDLVMREKDRGQSDAINKGFRHATGDILNWLNSDDYLFPRALEQVAAAFADDPSLDVVYGDCVYTRENGEFLRYFTEVRPFDRDVLLNRSNFIMQPACFYRREAAMRVGLLREHLHYTMDWDLWCRLAKAGCRFRYLPELLAANREHGVTKTLSGGGARQREIRAMHREHRTSLVPWAAISFALGDRLKRLAGTDRPPALYRWIRRGKRLLRGEPQNHLYGLEAHGTRLDPQFRIRFPWYGPPPRAARLTLAASRPATVALQKDIARSVHGVATLDIPLSPTHDIDLRGSHDRRAAVNLLRVEVLT